MPTGEPRTPVQVREIRSPRDQALGRAHRLLKQVFPRAELLPLRDWRESLREREAGLWTDLDWHLLVAEWEGKLAGAASGSYIGNLNVGLVGYVAVVPELRGTGVGGRLREALRAAIEYDARRIRGRPLAAMIGEVHVENPWLAHLAREQGVLALDFPYLQPSLHNTARPVELVLYVQPLRGRRGSVPADEVRRLVYTLWRRVYRIDRPMTRPAFRRMLRVLPLGARIRSRPPESLGPRRKKPAARRALAPLRRPRTTPR